MVITFDSVQDFSKSTKYEELEVVDDKISDTVYSNKKVIDRFGIVEKYKGRNNNSSGSYFKEYLRPKYHITPEMGVLADPCGFVYYKGLYHLYFQYNPYTAFRNVETWGHLVSNDMVQWDYSPIAIHRTDIYDIWSGNCFVDTENVSGLGKNVLLAYCTEYDGSNQSNAIYYSYDGYTFERYKTFLDASESPTASSSNDFRDPKVIWYPIGQYYIMSICCYKSVAFYKSTNLIDWEYVNKFNYTAQMECPNIVYYEKFDCMAVFMAISGTTYAFYGRWTDSGYSNLTAGKKINGGYPYAMDTLTNSPDGKIYGIAFCSPSKTTVLHNLMTSIVELDVTNVSTTTSSSQIRCIQRPLKNLLDTFSKVDSFEYNVTSNKAYALPANLTSGYMHVEFDYSGVVEDARGKYPGIKLFTSTTEYLLIQYNKPANYITVNRTYCGDKENYSGLVPISDTFELVDDKLTLDILFDEKIVEVFVNNGDAAITVPVLPRANGIVIDAKKTMKIIGEVYCAPYLLDSRNKLMSNVELYVPADNDKIKLTSEGLRLQSLNDGVARYTLSIKKYIPSFIKTDFISDSFFNDKSITAKVIIGYADDKNYMYADYGVNFVKIVKVKNGAESTITSADATITRAINHEAKLVYSENVLTAYLDGLEIVSATGITLPSGNVGFGMHEIMVRLHSITFI